MCKPVRVLGRIGLRLLPLGLRDLAFNLEGDAIGAGDAEARGVASDLMSGEQLTTTNYIHMRMKQEARGRGRDKGAHRTCAKHVHVMSWEARDQVDDPALEGKCQ